MSRSWSQLFEARRSIEKRFGRIRAQPEIRRPRRVLPGLVQDGMRVLDVGAGDRRNKKHLDDLAANCMYESLDPDPAGNHEHRDWSTVENGFDLVLSFEVVEHLDREEIPPYISSIAGACRAGGYVVVSTPNTWHPQEFLRDMTHKTPVPYDQLGGLLELAGLRVEAIYRVHPGGVIGRFCRRVLFRWLFALMRSDYARQIVVVARAPQVA